MVFFFQKRIFFIYHCKIDITQEFLLLSKKITVHVMFSTNGLVQNMSIDEMKIHPYLK